MRMPISAPEAGIRGSIGAMHITFKLYAGLTDYLPAEHRTGNLMPLEVAPGATIAQIIEPFHMPEKLVKLVLDITHRFGAARTELLAARDKRRCW